MKFKKFKLSPPTVPQNATYESAKFKFQKLAQKLAGNNSIISDRFKINVDFEDMDASRFIHPDMAKSSGRSLNNMTAWDIKTQTSPLPEPQKSQPVTPSGLIH